ncbi:MAG: DUF2200 domain-containing protein [Candidatus Andeanibacterium colombiense]|uniref:DUF2200 domain-containing protein n=1 Tax=Candidatus Andeanibacterium colombiense TaxID=3121345 RepID=A0AAJ5X9Y2_9SPHN|nr:MAG: DUF2200 domain-containing protein [Sphingomonadaceae bacterium]
MGSASMTERQQKNARRLYAMPFAKLYPALLAKVERKGRSKAELDAAICWLTGHDPHSLAAALADGIATGEFFTGAPAPNPARSAITGMVCGVRVEEVEDPVMREVRYLDKLVDELAKGWAMERVLRG